MGVNIESERFRKNEAELPAEELFDRAILDRIATDTVNSHWERAMYVGCCCNYEAATEKPSVKFLGRGLDLTQLEQLSAGLYNISEIARNHSKIKEWWEGVGRELSAVAAEVGPGGRGNRLKRPPRWMEAIAAWDAATEVVGKALDILGAVSTSAKSSLTDEEIIVLNYADVASFRAFELALMARARYSGMYTFVYIGPEKLRMYGVELPQSTWTWLKVE